jgi:hypothetical protein
MTDRGIAILLWIAFAAVAWNVVFDRAVADAATAYTREQIRRDQRGEPTESIDVAYRPQVRSAAVSASAVAGAVLICGACAIAVAGRAS